MDLAALKSGLGNAIPFNSLLGLELEELEPGRAVVVLPEDERLNNHVGSQHAGALFSAGEWASGAAFVGGFAERLGEVTPLAQSAEIEYTRIAKGPITATGRLGEDLDSVLATLEAEGVVRFPVEVELTDADGQDVARMTVRWYVRRNDTR